MSSEETFRQKKEETYTRFDGRCRKLLVDFLREKNEAVCVVCSESCGDGEKLHRALRYLVETLALAAAKRCENKVDSLVCVLAPYLSTVDMVEHLDKKGKTVKALTKELASMKENLLDIIRGGESAKN